MFGRLGTELRGGWIAAAALVAASGALGAQEGEQEECELSAPEAVRQAEQLMDEAAGLDTIPGEDAAPKYREALVRVRLALKQENPSPVAYWAAGRANIGLNQFAAADSMLSRFEALKPACTDMLQALRQRGWARAYNAGVRAYQAGEQDQALAMFEAANEMRDDPRSLNNAAILAQQAGKPERAIELYRRSIRSGQDGQELTTATVNLAELLRGQGKTGEALEVYASYLRDHPDDPTVAIRYGLTLRSVAAGDSSRAALADSAQAVMGRLVERDDLSFGEWFDLGIGLLQSQEYSSAERALEKARQLRAYDKLTMENLSQVYRVTGKLEASAALGDTLIDWYPYQPDQYRAYIQTLDQQGRTGRVQQLLPRIQNLPVKFTQLDLVQEGRSRYVVRGQVEPGSVAGQTVTIHFEFLGPSGEVVTTREAEIQVPADGTRNFQVALESDETIVGFRHGELARGS